MRANVSDLVSTVFKCEFLSHLFMKDESTFFGVEDTCLFFFRNSDVWQSNASFSSKRSPLLGMGTLRKVFEVCVDFHT